MKKFPANTAALSLVGEEARDRWVDPKIETPPIRGSAPAQALPWSCWLTLLLVDDNLFPGASL